MIDFTKKIPGSSPVKQVDPVALYDNLDRQTTAGPLRPIQEVILHDWYNHRFGDKDVIVKLHTGEGKTLIGLLMLQSRLNAGKGPAIFVCPTIQLAKQAAKDAVKFGISHILDLGHTDIPEEVIEGKKLWITYIQRMFNGLTIFGIDNYGKSIGTIVVDDSHACIESIRNAMSLHIKRDHQLFRTLLAVFSTDLRQQGEGTFYDIEGNDYSTEVMQVPYWAWIEKTGEVSKLLYQYSEEIEFKFVYPLLKDILKDCTAYVSSQYIEITPDFSLMHRFLFFANCNQRIFMSATTQDDSFFIKGFGLSRQSILNPLIDTTKKWSGEKMILFPTRVDDGITMEMMRQYICNIGAKGTAKCVALVPSRRIGENYKLYGATVPVGDEITKELEYLKSDENPNPHTVVFVNRYDGIDLADNQCRILMIDSKPSLGTLVDKYEQSCREDSDIVATKVAQKIEQGLGRSVRSEKDFSVIFMISEDLVRFVKSSQNQKFFSPQTRQQIKIAEDMLQMLKEDAHIEGKKVIPNIIAQCLNRDEGWKAYYHQSMQQTEDAENVHPYISIIEQEDKAEHQILHGLYNDAFETYQQIANLFRDRAFEKGWYLQKAAKCKYFINKIDARALQSVAHRCNLYLLKPEDLRYDPIDQINQRAVELSLQYIKKHPSYQDFQIHLNAVLSDLSFGISSKKFEAALHEIGLLLGYISQRPDQVANAGPDNLWMEPATRQFFAFECKNEVLSGRTSINKSEVGQMNNHIGWFEKNYKTDTNVSYIHIHATNVISGQANYNQEVRIMTPAKLNELRSSVNDMVKELAKYKLNSLNEHVITEVLRVNHLMASDIKSRYTVEAIKQE